ncbi:MAG: hypothetical protein ACYTGB_00075 [Planctomycetota bacterium]|jgi:hypothetical protein
MKTRSAILLSSLALLLAPASAGERPAGIPAEAVKVYGGIAAGKGGRVHPRSATLKTREGKVYRIVLDPKGRSLVKVMHRERAEVWGLVSRKGGADWLQVLDYTDPRLVAGHELWRRMRCNACVVLPATINAARPRRSHGAVEVTGRYYSFREKYSAWTRDEKYLWMAADNRIVQIDLETRKVLRSLGRADGLPDELILQLASDGKTLWIAHRRGAAALKIDGDRIRDLPELKADFVRLHLGEKGGWAIADTGTFRLTSAEDKPAALPALPTGARIRQAVEGGIWIPHWERRTGHFVVSPASVGERLYAGSYGDLYELADGKWEKVASGGWDCAAGGGRIWCLGTTGLTEYDPAAKKTTQHELPEDCRGRPARLLVTGAAVWVAVDPAPPAGGGRPTGGGLARFDLAKREWKGWNRIGEAGAARVSCLTAEGGTVWAVTLDGKWSTKSAHPGMTTTRKNLFETTGLRLHRFDAEKLGWKSWALKLSELEKRLICGQDGKRGEDGVLPEFVERMSVGPQRIFAATRLVPARYFGGYWPCVNQLAAKKGDEWSAGFGHSPAQLRMQGEQPPVLNISHGELSRIGSALKDQLWEAVAHDLVLGLFVREGTHWAATDGCAAFFDADAGKWKRVLEPGYRWYWRASAALEDGGWLYIGSDRGLVGRLNVAGGGFEPLGALKDRCVTRFAKGQDGKIFLATEMAPLGQLPVFLAGGLQQLDCEAAVFDGKTLAPAKAGDVPAAAGNPKWIFRLFDRKGHFDKTRGNWLCERVPGEAEPKPRYYLKEVFFPLFLCEGGEGRMWISTYTGLLRLVPPRAKEPASDW